MGMNMNPAGSGLGDNYNAPVAGGQSLPPEKKKDGLPAGQIATTAVVGAGTLGFTHYNLQKEKAVAELINDSNSDVSEVLLLAKKRLEELKNKLGLNSNELLEKRVLEKELKYIDGVKAKDFSKTWLHFGKNIGWAALAAGATALIYGGIRTLVNRNKQPPPTATPTPTA
jgi:hypothetical protein